MYGHNSTGSPQPAPSLQADMTTRQAAAAAMQIERGRSNPGFGELPLVASSLPPNPKQPQVTAAAQPQKDPPSAIHSQQLSINPQQRLPHTQAPIQPPVTSTTASVPIQPHPASNWLPAGPVSSSLQPPPRTAATPPHNPSFQRPHSHALA